MDLVKRDKTQIVIEIISHYWSVLQKHGPQSRQMLRLSSFQT